MFFEEGSLKQGLFQLFLELFHSLLQGLLARHLGFLQRNRILFRSFADAHHQHQFLPLADYDFIICNLLDNFEQLVDVFCNFSDMSREYIVSKSPEKHDAFVRVRDVDEKFVLSAGKLSQISVDSTFEGHLQ